MRKLILFLIFCFFTFNCMAVEWVGHRGSRGLYPENTIGAMKEALKFQEIGAIEFDVVISKDGEVVVSHEPWFNPDICLNPDGSEIKKMDHNFFQMSYAEIATFDCGSKFYPAFPRQAKLKVSKPLLIDLIQSVEIEAITLNHFPNYFIEIKSKNSLIKDGYQPNIPFLTDKVVGAIEKSKVPLERVRIASIDFDVLRYLHKIRPAWKTILFSKYPRNVNRVVRNLGFKPTIYGPINLTLTKNNIESFQKNGISVYPWTMSTVKQMKRMLEKGVDGLIIDYPDLITELE